MPPRKSNTLTEAELRLMEVLWQRDSATVHQLLEALPAQPALAYNSVLTTIRILEKKGYVQHVKDGRAHIYRAVVGRKEATRFAVRNLVNRFFKDSHELLVLNLIEDKSLDQDELRRLSQLLHEGGQQP
ncbi:MAG: BlaI/MecI/CopY family transcriptional regulator [Terriglobales bacterium]